MKITIIFFAYLKDRASRDNVIMEVEPGISIVDLKYLLEQRFPLLNDRLDHVIVAINREFAHDKSTIPDGAEVAFFPPVSGGIGHPFLIELTCNPISFDEIILKLTTETTGGICVFSGIVRGVTIGDNAHITLELEYEAYQQMAQIKMVQIAQKIRERWPVVEGIAIIQRIGKLEPGTPSVIVACTAAHRNDGIFEAARYGIDRLKQIVPVWKKEILSDGEAWVEGNYYPKPGE